MHVEIVRLPKVWPNAAHGGRALVGDVISPSIPPTMPQATKLRLVRGGRDTTRPSVSGSVHSLVQHHAFQTRRVHTLAATIAADTDVLVEALRYFIVAPPVRAAG